jgi:hypothetical protein
MKMKLKNSSQLQLDQHNVSGWQSHLAGRKLSFQLVLPPKSFDV